MDCFVIFPHFSRLPETALGFWPAFSSLFLAPFSTPGVPSLCLAPQNCFTGYFNIPRVSQYISDFCCCLTFIVNENYFWCAIFSVYCTFYLHWTRKWIYSGLPVEQMCRKFGAPILLFICTVCKCYSNVKVYLYASVV